MPTIVLAESLKTIDDISFRGINFLHKVMKVMKTLDKISWKTFKSSDTGGERLNTVDNIYLKANQYLATCGDN